MKARAKIAANTKRTPARSQKPPTYPAEVATMYPVTTGPSACPMSITVPRKPIADPEAESLEMSDTKAVVEDVAAEKPKP
jgi:hypothetical protein